MSIEVSIICNVYNHQDYLRQCLESLISQKTNFGFEILIHDDASQDGSPEIIQEYAKMYPSIVKPLLQTENQYSKGIDIVYTHQISRARGKYLALCEGDDFWTDNLKLQKQYDALEMNPEINICAHNATIVSNDGQKTLSIISPSKENKIFSVEQVILGGGGFVATNSLMLRKTAFNNKLLFETFLFTDYVYQIKGSLNKGMVFLKDYMSSYRWMARNSWTTKFTTNVEMRLKYFNAKKKMLEALKENTNHAYDNTINKVMFYDELDVLLVQKKYKELRQKKYISRIQQCEPSIKKYYYRMIWFPKTTAFLKAIRRRIKGI